MSNYHLSVLRQEVIDGLHILPGSWYVDATLGGGGHTEAIIAAGGRVLGLDQDQDSLDFVAGRLSQPIERGNLRLTKGNFRDLHTLCAQEQLDSVAGVLFDLGVSSHQLDELSRGFSFQSATLDMRMDAAQAVSALELVEALSEKDLTALLEDWGEERYARRFAQAIVSARARQPITSGTQLAEIISVASPSHYRYGSIHPATRTFQALRLAVNDELPSLEQALPQAVDILRPDGRLAVISFHSLEDRVVKQFLHNQDRLTTLTKKPIVAGDEELIFNPRARSAKLRLAEKR